MVLEGLVLTGANDNSASGIKSLRSDVVIKNCLIAGNRRRTSGSAGGGALSCSHSGGDIDQLYLDRELRGYQRRRYLCQLDQYCDDYGFNSMGVINRLKS